MPACSGVAGLRPGSIGAAAGGVEDDRRGAELGEGAHAGLGDGQLARAAQEDEEALAALEVEVQALRQLRAGARG